MYILTIYENYGTYNHPRWDVYVISADGSQEYLSSFAFQTPAIEYAHAVGTPVMRGKCSSIEVSEIIKKLMINENYNA